MVQNRSTGNSAFYFLGGGVTAVLPDPGSGFSATKDTASKINVYVESGAIKIQNKTSAQAVVAWNTTFME